jgi:poly(beta-D-mannuronate) C5 epimerase
MWSFVVLGMGLLSACGNPGPYRVGSCNTDAQLETEDNTFDIRCFVPSPTTAPELPDTSIYTSEDARALLPEPKAGEAAVVLTSSLPVIDHMLQQQGLATLSEIQQTDEPVVLAITRGDWTLEMLRQHIADDAYLSAEGSVYTLEVPVLILGEASLAVLGPEVTTLKLSSNRGGFLSNHGGLYVIDTDLLGWNTVTQTPAWFEDKTQWRPYIATWTGSETYLVGSTLSHLGYDQHKSYGVTFSTTGESLVQQIPNASPPYGFDIDPDEWPIGWLSHNTMHNNYMSFYSYEAMDVAIVGNTITDGILYGLDPHDRSTRLLIAENTITGTRELHGLITSREVNHSFIVHNYLEGNARSGIMLDRTSVDNVVAYNEVFNNGTDGITIYESQDNLLYGNHVQGNRETGIRLRNSWNVDVIANILESHPKYGIHGYTSDLALDPESSGRDFELDPFSQRVGARIDANTFSGNLQGHIRVDDLEQLCLSRVDVGTDDEDLFNGDLKDYDWFAEMVMQDGYGVWFEPMK